MALGISNRIKEPRWAVEPGYYYLAPLAPLAPSFFTKGNGLLKWSRRQAESPRKSNRDGGAMLVVPGYYYLEPLEPLEPPIFTKGNCVLKSMDSGTEYQALGMAAPCWKCSYYYYIELLEHLEHCYIKARILRVSVIRGISARRLGRPKAISMMFISSPCGLARLEVAIATPEWFRSVRRPTVLHCVRLFFLFRWFKVVQALQS